MTPPNNPARTPRTLDHAVAEATAARRASGTLTDMERVLAIPHRAPDADAAVALATLTFAHRGAPRLRPGQALALLAMAEAPAGRGVVANLPVGEGKTLVAMLAAEAFALGGDRPARALVLVPAPLVKQWASMVATWSRAYRFDPPACLSYGMLSTPKGEAAFRAASPDLVIFDEAHALANPASARTRRVVRWFVDNPTTRAVVMTGTLGVALTRYAHLFELALREGAPLPLERGTLEQWAACLDPKGEASADDWRALWPLVRAFDTRAAAGPFGNLTNKQRREMSRGAFALRLDTTPGYVRVEGSGIGASLRAAVLRPPPPPSVTAALAALADDWTLPDGTELVDALEFDRHAGSLAVGFYRRQTWDSCDRCNGAGGWTSPRVAGQWDPCDACDGRGEVVDVAYVEARRNWHAAVRNALEWSARSGFDSPALVEAACEAGRVGDRLLRPYEAWCEVRGRGGPGSEVVWLDGARAHLQATAAAWCAGRDAGILWWLSPAVGEALAEVPGVTGPFGAGSSQPTHPVGAWIGRKHDLHHDAFPAVSMRVHGTGWNAQAWAESLIVEVPASSDLFEQVVGRTHRPGQLAGAVRFDVLASTWRPRRALETAIARATYVVQSRGESQKLTVAQWEE